MKKRLLLTVIVLIVTVAFIYTGRGNKEEIKRELITFGLSSESLKSTDLGEDEEENELENPIDRAEYEASLLIDPATGKVPMGIQNREVAYAKKSLNKIKDAGSPLGIPSAAAGTQEDAPFRNIGPFNVGGRTRALGLDVDDENIILAGGVSGGVWKSTDQGQSWTRTTSLQQHPATTTLVQDRRSGMTDEWYYATGEIRGNSAGASGATYLGNGIYKSTNNGDSWTLISSTAVPGTSGTDVITDLGDFTRTEQLAIDYSNDTGTEIYAAGGSQIIRSVDGFETFDIVLGETNTGSNMCDVAITSTGKVFATIANSSNNGSNAEQGVFMSDDGITWTEIDLEGRDNVSTRIEIAIDPSDENNVYFLTEDQLILFNDLTDSSTDLTSSIEVSDDSGEGYNSQGAYDVITAVHPDDGSIVFVAGTNLLRSTNGFGTSATNDQIGGYRADGNSNSFPSYPNHHPDLHEIIFFDSDADIMLTGSDGGVHLTRNNQQIGSSTSSVSVVWEDLNNGYVVSQFYHANIHPTNFGDVQVVGGTQDNSTYASFNGEDEGDWDFIRGGDGAFAAITYNALYASSQRGSVGRYALVGNQYQNGIGITPGENETFLFVNPFNYNPVNQDQFFIAGQGKLFATNDIRQNPSGNEWLELSGPASLTNQFVSAITGSVDPEAVLYFGTRSGGLFKIADTRGMTESTEIITVDTGNMPGGNVSGIAIDPNDTDRVFVSFSNYNVVSVWMTSDGGETWSSISGNLEENADGSGAGPSVRGIEVMPDGNGGNYYFAATSVGLFMTKELKGDETNWEQQAADVIGNVVVSNVRVRPIDGIVMAATHGNGVFLGGYDVGINANINYSISTDGREYELRANGAAVTPSPLSYQWIKDGEDIEGETGEILTVTDGGAYQVRLAIEGTSGTGLSNTVNVNLDGQGPEVSTITRLDPTDAATDQTTVQFQVTFNETVLNVSTDDFETVSAASGVITSVVESTVGTVFDVTVSNIGGSGELNLDIAASTDITDEVGNAFSGTVLSEETYTITDNTDPTGSINRSVPTTQVTDQNEVTFLVTFSEAVDNVDVTDFALAAGSPTATLGAVTEVNAISYQVVVTDILADGTLGLDFAAGQDIVDKAGNAFDGVAVTDETYTIENVITSIDDPLARAAERIIVDANPSSGVFNLAFPPAYIGNFEMQIVDSQGRKVLVRGVKNYNTGDQVEINLTNSPDGVYILAASNGSVRSTIKLLKSEGSR
ncbi:T9SS type A sorting domain-containing protein [Roseivirga sp.]|uniref:T9SS type A sorting domain-containing protein n=1 Tax=Roseivirga sp. TaxID=1964215 RepID=UPI003B8B0061